MSQAARSVDPDIETIQHPISDGGEGLVDVLTRALGGSVETTEVNGPLVGQRVKAAWGLSKDCTTAIIEMATAAGLPLVPESRRNPKITTTFGVGELIHAALDRGAESIIVGIGGSATNDGGAGMAEALGVKFFDSSGMPLPRGGAALRQLDRIDVAALEERVALTRFTVACDVRNPLCGSEGASLVFGPQKGGTPADCQMLDQALTRYGKKIMKTIGIDVLSIPGGGAAGGLGAGLVAFCGATLKRGIDIVLEMTGFDARLQDANLVLTGEGKIDAQLDFGKALSGVVERASQLRKPVLAVAGIVEGEPQSYRDRHLFYDVEPIVNSETPVERAMRDAEVLLFHRTQTLLRRYLAASG